MLVLALDTTTRPGSLALLQDEHVVAVESGEASQPHAERLPGAIVRLLSEHGHDVRAVDLFAVAAGPGSFTGLRIGIATIQGLAFALDRPVVGVSVLDALASVGAEHAVTSHSKPGPFLVGAFMDAQRAEVFAALYQAAGSRLQPSEVRAPDREPGRADAASAVASSEAGSQEPEAGSLKPEAFVLFDGPVSEPPAVVLERWKQFTAKSTAPSTGNEARVRANVKGVGAEVVFAGDGVARYRDLVVQHFGPAFRSVDPLPPLAATIARLALVEAREGRATSPHAVRPIYVRRSDAELARDRPREPR